MGLPALLVDYNCYHNSVSWIGKVPEVTPPKIAVKTAQIRNGGMLSEVDVNMGLEKMEMETKMGGFMRDVLRTMGAIGVAEQMLRYRGAYQEPDTKAVLAAELVVRGMHTELDMGSSKVGDPTEWTLKSSITYLKWTVNGTVDLEIDVLNYIWTAGGVDLLAGVRAALLR